MSELISIQLSRAEQWLCHSHARPKTSIYACKSASTVVLQYALRENAARFVMATSGQMQVLQVENSDLGRMLASLNGDLRPAVPQYRAHFP